MSLKHSESSQDTTKSLPWQGTKNLKITSGVYRENYSKRLQAYNLSPKSVEQTADMFKRIKEAHEVELKYMNEYITVLKSRIHPNLNALDQQKIENTLRYDINVLNQKLKYEQYANLILLKKIEDFKNEPGQKFKENPLNKVKSTEIIKYSYEKNSNLYQIFQEKFNDSMNFISKEFRKLEEKLDRIDLENFKIKNEMKVLKKILSMKSKENSIENGSSIKTLKEELQNLQIKNSSMASIIQDLEKDLDFYQSENKKHREIIKDLSDESKIEKNTILALTGSADLDFYEIELNKNLGSGYIRKESDLCYQCIDLNEQIKLLEDKIIQCELINSKLNQDVMKTQEDNQNLENIISNLQDLIADNTPRPYNLSSTQEVRELSEKNSELQEKIKKMLRENYKILKKYRKVSGELQETVLKPENCMNNSFSLNVVKELEVLKKDYNFIVFKNKALMDAKLKFLELLRLISTKNIIEQEILKITNLAPVSSEDCDEKETLSKLKSELNEKNTRIQEMVSCFLNLN
jgi:chromosome segregation ATPase